MKRRTLLYGFALLLGAAAWTGCQKETADEAIPEGMARLSVAGVEAGAFTRADITTIDDIDSFTLTFEALSKTVTVTKSGTAWTLSETVYLDVNSPGKITAQYIASGVADQRDDLTAETGKGIELMYNSVTRQLELSVAFRHANALLDIAVKDSEGNDLKDRITRIQMIDGWGNFYNGGLQQILPGGSKLYVITVYFSATDYIEVADPAKTLLEANKRYQVTITLDADGLRPALMTVGSGIENWGPSEPVEWRDPPAGYDIAIWSGAQLAAFRDLVNANDFLPAPNNTIRATEAKVIQLCDIDLSDYQSGEGWEAIGAVVIGVSYPFLGTYNGNGFRITGLKINRSTADFQGLFGLASTLANLVGIHIVGADVTGNDYVGALVGSSDGSTSLCSATGTVTGKDYVGGFIGYHSSLGSITRSRAAVTVDGSGGTHIGGLVGQNYGTIVACEVSSGVSGSSSVGSFAGENNGTIWFSSTKQDLNFASIGTGIAYSCYQAGNPVGTAATVTDSTIPTVILGANGYEDMTIEERYFVGSKVWKSTPGDDIDYAYAGVKPLRSTVQGYDVEITSPEDFAFLATLVNAGATLPGTTPAAEAKVIQTADLDLSGYPNWIPVGTESNPFSGTYNGNGKTTENLTIASTSTDHVGLFGYASGATLTGVNLTGVSITSSNDYVGSLLGYAKDISTVSLCTASGQVSGKSSVGGLLGAVTTGSHVTRCGANVDVTGSFYHAGGFIGWSHGAQLLGCESTGTVTGVNNVGGFVGGMQMSRVVFCTTPNADNFYGFQEFMATLSHCYYNNILVGDSDPFSTPTRTVLKGSSGYEDFTVAERLFEEADIWATTDQRKVDFDYEGIAP